MRDVNSLDLGHYSPKPLRRTARFRYRQGLSHWGFTIGKPKAFWLSADACPNSWKDWARGEDFHPENLRYRYSVRVDPNAVLWIRTEKNLRGFGKEYSTPNPIGFMHRMIAWDRVARKYHGIVIAPYCWRLRLDPEFFWYYGWDCASGAIWDSRGIVSWGRPSLTPDERKYNVD